MFRPLAIALALGALAGPVKAQVWRAIGGFQIPVEWASEPSAAMLQAAKPAGAPDARAVLSCGQRADGALNNCRAVDATAPRAETQAAALSLTSLFRMEAGRAQVLSSLDPTVTLRISWPASRSPSVEGRVTMRAQDMWAQLPSERSVYEAKPKGVEAEGRVSLLCDVLATGRLTRCEFDEMDVERGRGFSAAAKSLLPMFQVEPKIARKLAALGGRASIPIIFIGKQERCLPPYCNNHGGVLDARRTPALTPR